MQKLLTREDLAARGIAFSNKHLLFLERQGRFPRRVTLGHSTVAWSEDEINAYIAGRLAARGAYATRVLIPDTAA